MSDPFVSVLVPVRNEERYLERCLYSIARQTYPRERLEVIVIDGMSDDATRQVVARFTAESSLDVRLLDNPERLPAHAMNIGLEAARGDVIARLDGHAAMEPDYLRRCVDALAAPVGAGNGEADCAGGVLISEGGTYAGDVIALAMSSRFGVGGAAFRTGGAAGSGPRPVDTVAFGAYRRDVFDRIGGFAEDIPRGEDDEFNYRLRDAGGVILLLPDARVRYTVRGDIGALWRQYYGYGRAKPEVLARHPSQAQLRQFVPAVFVKALGVFGIAAIFGNTKPLKALLGVYTLAATIATLALLPQRRWRLLPPLPAAFACLHVSYGLGVLTGCLGLAGSRLARAARPGAHQSTEAPNPRG